ncbi:hypothetical protein AVHY2522_11220 [Acidovorax sp. SUPP2522]|uniref:hypothetical protein n=1 Tax=unclassified Acidovorax TaxID=2684926 RepID=UPI00234A456F|nr:MULTISPECIES: hypothetical protein [unclassified Acidovorax]WCM99448.1 hypothetical protein M5C96_08540 [Acidovorax sp. GBBC 1281]GKT16308.1 hypothetical protein AVHY2522_11220 [Acidovorax sp. SUPP2522]
MNFVLVYVIFPGNGRRNLLPGQFALIIMKSTAEIRRHIARTTALLRMLCEREGITSIYGFAVKYDALAAPVHLTRYHGKNGWQALFKGVRPLSAARLRALSAVEAWSDATTLYENGPENLWRAMWGPPDQLRLVIADELNECRSFDQVVAEFEGELLLAHEYRAPLTLVHLAKAIALYRLQYEILGLSDAGVSGGVAQCLCNEVLQAEMERLGVRQMVNEELAKFHRTGANYEFTSLTVAARWEAVAARLDWVS